jgi:hypothetical protein
MGNNYKYKGLPFTEVIAEKLLNNQSGQEFLIDKVGELVLQHHLDRDGSPPETKLSEIVLRAFHLLRANGRAKRVSKTDKEVWEIFPNGRRIFGSAQGAVYCFYNPRDRDKAEANNEERWACNIGETGGDVEERVRQQTRQWTVKPKIDLIIRTSEHRDLESKIHDVLKALNMHLSNFQASGREWFQTSPDEIVYIATSILPRFGFRYF